MSLSDTYPFSPPRFPRAVNFVDVENPMTIEFTSPMNQTRLSKSTTIDSSRRTVTRRTSTKIGIENSEILQAQVSAFHILQLMTYRGLPSGFYCIALY